MMIIQNRQKLYCYTYSIGIHQLQIPMLFKITSSYASNDVSLAEQQLHLTPALTLHR